MIRLFGNRNPFLDHNRRMMKLLRSMDHDFDLSFPRETYLDCFFSWPDEKPVWIVSKQSNELEQLQSEFEKDYQNLLKTYESKVESTLKKLETEKEPEKEPEKGTRKSFPETSSQGFGVQFRVGDYQDL